MRMPKGLKGIGERWSKVDPTIKRLISEDIKRKYVFTSYREWLEDILLRVVSGNNFTDRQNKADCLEIDKLELLCDLLKLEVRKAKFETRCMERAQEERWLNSDIGHAAVRVREFQESLGVDSVPIRDAMDRLGGINMAGRAASIPRDPVSLSKLLGEKARMMGLAKAIIVALPGAQERVLHKEYNKVFACKPEVSFVVAKKWALKVANPWGSVVKGGSNE